MHCRRTVWVVGVSVLALGWLVVSGCNKAAQCPTTPRARAAAVGFPAPVSLDPYVAAPLTTTSSVVVDALWVRTRRDKLTRKVTRTGGTTRVRLFASPNPARVASIGVSEQFPGGAGNSWKASVWIAARMASQAVGREIVDYRFSAESGGFIDGPSAGALFTAGFMAAITGVQVLPEVTMTGTVNPDGTVGAVAGLEYKFLGALKKGKKVLGYPEGNKLVKGKGGRVVNLETLAAEHNAKAVAVRDVFEAYKLLTGKAFPKQYKATPADLAFPKNVTATLLGRAEAWRKEHSQYVQSGKEMATDSLSKRMFSARIKPATIYHALSLSAAKAGASGAAYYAAVRSATWAYTAAKFTDVVYLWKQWLALVTKRMATARLGFRALIMKRLQLRLRGRQEATCKKEKWKRPACKKLQATIKREKAAEKLQKAIAKRKTAAEKRKKAAEKKRAEQCKKRQWKGFMCARLKAQLALAKQPVKPTLPPEPPKDFMKLLTEKAAIMDKKTKNIERVKADLDLVKPTTVDHALALVSGYAELVQGTAFAIVGRARLQLLKRYSRYKRYMKSVWMQRKMLYSTGNYVDETVKFAGIAFGKAKLAGELSGLYAPGSRTVQLSDARMKSIASQLFSAAKANLDYINSLLPKGLRGYMVRRWLSSRAPEYVIARLGMTRAGTLVFKFREAGETGKQIKLGSGYAALGAAVASYMASSKLIAKYLTLGIRHKTGSAVTAVRRPIDLTNALYRARNFALEGAYRAKKAVGSVPTFTRIQFETADVMRKESLSGQVKALELYWRAGLYARLAEMITR